MISGPYGRFGIESALVRRPPYRGIPAGLWRKNDPIWIVAGVAVTGEN